MNTLWRFLFILSGVCLITVPFFLLGAGFKFPDPFIMFIIGFSWVFGMKFLARKAGIKFTTKPESNE